MTPAALHKQLELALLDPALSIDDIEAGIELAAGRHLAAVVVHPAQVARAAALLEASDTAVVAAIGHPAGQDGLRTRCCAIDEALEAGASQLALVLGHAGLAGGRVRQAVDELDALLVHAGISELSGSRTRGMVTVVLETMLLEHLDLTPLWTRLAGSGVDFLQTGSGVLPTVVDATHLQRLRAALPDQVAIKACGGIARLDHASGLLASGAVRACSAAAVSIAGEARAEQLRRSRGG